MPEKKLLPQMRYTRFDFPSIHTSFPSSSLSKDGNIYFNYVKP